MCCRRLCGNILATRNHQGYRPKKLPPSTSSCRKATNVTIDAGLLEQAKRFGGDLSKASEEGLSPAVVAGKKPLGLVMSGNEAPSTSATDVLAPLREVLSHFPYVGLAVLFGSVAAGRARADSDVDLAVSASRPLTSAERLQITQALAEKTGRPVDLIDLSSVSAPLLGQIVRHGKRAQGSVAEFGHLINRHLIEQADFMPLLNRVLRQRRMAWIGK